MSEQVRLVTALASAMVSGPDLMDHQLEMASAMALVSDLMDHQLVMGSALGPAPDTEDLKDSSATDKASAMESALPSELPIEHYSELRRRLASRPRQS